MLHHLLRALVWQIRLTRSELALRIGRLLSLLLVAGSFGTALGYHWVRRARTPPEGEAETAPASHP